MSLSSSSSSPWIVSSLGGDDNTNTDAISTEPTQTNDAVVVDVAVPVPTTTRLFLHFDVNETILLGDDAGGDSRNESAQKMLAKSAFCRIPSVVPDDDGNKCEWESTNVMKPTHWWDGQEIGAETSMPPLYTGWEWPPECVPYYRTAYKKHAKRFTEHHGKIYAPLLEACEAKLSSVRKSKTEGSNTILPAFYETLRHLIETENDDTNNDPPFTVVFRTFGSDLPDIAKVVTAFAKGEHPEYPDTDFPPLCLSEDRLYQGRWKVVSNDDDDDDDGDNCPSEAKAIYQLWNSDESKLVAEGDAEILDFLSSNSSSGTNRIFGIRDDYNFWKKHGYRPTAGKPIWVPNYNKMMGNNNNNNNNNNTAEGEPKNTYFHHLLFDDNIHNLPDDCIATVRREEGSSNDDASRHPTFETVDGANMGAYQGVHLVRVPTVEPVLNPKWYVEQIETARNRLQVRLQSSSSSSSTTTITESQSE